MELTRPHSLSTSTSRICDTGEVTMPNVLYATGGRGDASCVWSCAPPNFSRLQAQRIYDRLRKRLYSLNHLIDGLDVLGNGVLSGSRVGHGRVVKLRHWSGAAVGIVGDPHHMAALLQCFIAHALEGGTI